MVVNSDSFQAASISGTGTVTAQNIYINGGYIGGSKFVGAVTSPSPAVADPVAPLPSLDPNSLTLQSSVPINLTGDATLLPGLYVGGVTFSGGTLILQPGVYFFQGGGLSITATTLTATGVLIYNAPGNSPFFGQPINILVTGTLAVSPTTTGPYQGISIWQDDNITSAVILTFNGTNASLTGTVYVPGASVRINGSQNLNGAQIISRRLRILSSGSLIVDPTAQRRNTRRIQLVE